MGVMGPRAPIAETRERRSPFCLYAWGKGPCLHPTDQNVSSVHFWSEGKAVPALCGPYAVLTLAPLIAKPPSATFLRLGCRSYAALEPGVNKYRVLNGWCPVAQRYSTIVTRGSCSPIRSDMPTGTRCRCRHTADTGLPRL